MYWLILPGKLFKEPLSIVLEDRNGNLLSAHIAEDEQWRFPSSDSVPFKLKAAILTFEDKGFYTHRGVDGAAMLRALWLNIKYWDIISGGSTITMQVIRLARKGKSRTVPEKILEILMASRL